MSGEPEVTRTPEEEEEEEIKSSYRPPPEKTIDEILAADQEDESLRKYKEALLGEAQAGAVIVDVNDPRRVIVKKLALCVTGRDDVELDLSGDLTDLKKQVWNDYKCRVRAKLVSINANQRATGGGPSNASTLSPLEERTANILGRDVGPLPDVRQDQFALNDVFVIKEGVQYRIRIDFIVQREIVHGLKYVQKTYRLGVPVDKMTHMVGSYPPKTEIQSYTTPPEDAPSGIVARGSYSVNSLFTDDDKNVHLQWEWCFDIKKDWKD